MRIPSDETDLLAWHTSFMAGENPERHEGEPQCGWYKTRMVKSGPWVPVLIWCWQSIDENGQLDAPEEMRLVVDDRTDTRDPADIWLWLTPISKEEYDGLVADRERQRQARPATSAVDLSAAPTPPKG